mmetsp:Transcript_17837/g.15211  ORF Transcript_17837/g.15211 Transcript_17837/m.15211 type:complete len:140 (+) Transcript_17837:79-498(+)
MVLSLCLRLIHNLLEHEVTIATFLDLLEVELELDQRVVVDILINRSLSSADVRKQMGPEPSWSVIVSCALSLVTGAYGVVFMFEDEPDLLIGARKGSPLILGVGEGEYMLASDASAVVEYTKDVVYIRDGELVEVSEVK